MSDYEDWSSRKLKRVYISTLRRAWLHGELLYGDKVKKYKSELSRRGWYV